MFGCRLFLAFRAFFLFGDAFQEIRVDLNPVLLFRDRESYYVVPGRSELAHGVATRLRGRRFNRLGCGVVQLFCRRT